MVRRKKKSKKRAKRIQQIKIISVLVVIIAIVISIMAHFDIHNIWKNIEIRKDKKIIEDYTISNKIKEKDFSAFTVCLDAGHGGNDPGAIVDDRYEKDDDLKLTLKVKQVLEMMGVNVVMTRTTDEYPTLEERANIANDAKADLFVSIHRNYFEGWQDVNGIDVYINKGGSDEDYKIGKLLYEKLSGVDKMEVNEPKPGSSGDTAQNYKVVEYTNMTACLIEMGYMSYDKDNQYFDENVNTYAIAIAEGIVEYFI